MNALFNHPFFANSYIGADLPEEGKGEMEQEVGEFDVSTIIDEFEALREGRLMHQPVDLDEEKEKKL